MDNVAHVVVAGGDEACMESAVAADRVELAVMDP